MKKGCATFYGKVRAVLVNHTFGESVSTLVPKIRVAINLGVCGDTHASPDRPIDSRETELLKFGFLKGQSIANLRQFSGISEEEMAEVARDIGTLDIPYGCLGENLIVKGIPQFSQLPSGTLLFFRKNAEEIRSAVLMVMAQNEPCHIPGEAIQKNYTHRSDIPNLFRTKAVGKRGVVGIVLQSGIIKAGDEVIAKIPLQVPYEP